MNYIVTEHRKINADTYLLRLEGDTTGLHNPGQFVNIAVEGCFLRRPISVCDYDQNSITLVYEVVGRGTEKMTHFKNGDNVDLLCGLGNGFDPDTKCSAPVLLGGGIGVAPLYGLAKSLLQRGLKPVAVLGFNTKERIVMEEMFRNLGIDTYIATVDGSAGTKGFVTDALRINNIPYDIYYACGPMPMLKALGTGLDAEGQLSLDVRMACGFGACMCCSFKTTHGAVCVCKDGPVFNNNELLWNQE